jgi:hypothetical protein
MVFRTRIRSLKFQTGKGVRHSLRPVLEQLEDRWVPSLTNPGNNAVIPNIQLQAIYYNDLAGQPAVPKAALDAYLAYLAGSPYITMLNQYNTPTQTIATGSALAGYNTNITITSNITFNSNNGVAPSTTYNGLGVYDSQVQSSSSSPPESVSPPTPGTQTSTRSTTSPTTHGILTTASRSGTPSSSTPVRGEDRLMRPSPHFSS